MIERTNRWKEKEDRMIDCICIDHEKEEWLTVSITRKNKEKNIDCMYRSNKSKKKMMMTKRIDLMKARRRA